MPENFAVRGDSLLTSAVGKIFINCATSLREVHVEVEKMARR